MWCTLKYHYWLAIVTQVYFIIFPDQPILIWFTIRLFTVLIKALRAVSLFLSFKGLTHAYLVKKSMTDNTYLAFLFLEDNDLVSATSAAQILYLNLA